MNDRELMQQALDALEEVRYIDQNQKAIEALRARLAQPEPEREKLFGVINLDKDAPLTQADRKQLRIGLMACLLEDGVMAKLGMLINRYERTIESLETQPEPEPVAWFSKRPDNTLAIKIVGKPMEGDWEPLYTAPPQREITDDEFVAEAKRRGFFISSPQREWQGLTGQETNHLLAANADCAEKLIRAIEAKLREKNA